MTHNSQVANISSFKTIVYYYIFPIPSRKYQLLQNNCLLLYISHSKSQISTASKQLFIIIYFPFQVANINCFKTIVYYYIFPIPSRKYQLLQNNCLLLYISHSKSQISAASKQLFIIIYFPFQVANISWL